MIQNKVKSKLIFTEKRFNAGYFLNEDALNSFKLEINPQNCIALSELANVFNPPIFKRQFCQPSERAINYCQSSDVTNALEGSDVYINKKQAEKVGSVVKKNQILVTGFGTIGNTRLVNELSEGISYANNVCRIESNGKFPYGYLYAFMTSKFGRSQLNKNASGSVVRYIEAPGIKRTLVPILPEEKQQQIHQLIVDSANLRVEANKLLKEAVELMESYLPKIENDKIYVVSIKDRLKFNNRLEANFDTKQISNFYSKLENQNIELKEISYLSERVFTPNIFKRVRTDNPENGVPFLSGSDLLNQYPKFDSYLSKNMKNIDNYILRKDWLAIQDAGTIGYISYINEFLDGVSATNNLIRIVPNKENWNPYIYTFFKTDSGQKLLKYLEFGSVQKHIDNHQISSFKIPIFNEIEKDIKVKAALSNDKLAEACFKENQAINLIENEIDAWQ